MNGLAEQPRSWLAWPLAAVGLALLGGLAVAAGNETFALALAICGLGAALTVASRVDPAWPISAGIVLAVFSGNWEQLGLGFPVVPDRILLALGIGVLLLNILMARRRPSLRSDPAHLFLAVVAVYAIGSALWVGALGDSSSRFELLDRLGIVPFAMFVLAAVAFRTERQRAILLGSLVVLGAYLGATALLEALKIDPLVFPRYILDPTVGYQSGRARGPFASSVANGLGLYACAVAAVIAFASWRRPWPRAGAAVVAALCSAGLLFAVTRSIWLASVVATGGALLAFRELRRFVVPTAVAGVVLVLGALAVIPGLAERVRDRTDAQISLWDRRNTNAAAVSMIEAKPLLGFGWDQFDVVSRDYFQISDDYPLTGTDTTVHNVFLSHASELGLVGVTLFVLAFAIGIGGAILRRGPPELRLWRIGLLAVALHWLVVANFVPLPYTFPNLLLWTWAGLVAGGAAANGRNEPTPSARTAPRSFPS